MRLYVMKGYTPDYIEGSRYDVARVFATEEEAMKSYEMEKATLVGDLNNECPDSLDSFTISDVRYYHRAGTIASLSATVVYDPHREAHIDALRTWTVFNDRWKDYEPPKDGRINAEIARLSVEAVEVNIPAKQSKA